MDGHRFDTLAKSLTAGGSRRIALTGLAGGAVALLTGRTVENAASHAVWERCKNIPDKKKRAKCVKHGKEHKEWHKQKDEDLANKKDLYEAGLCLGGLKAASPFGPYAVLTAMATPNCISTLLKGGWQSFALAECIAAYPNSICESCLGCQHWGIG